MWKYVIPGGGGFCILANVYVSLSWIKAVSDGGGRSKMKWTRVCLTVAAALMLVLFPILIAMNMSNIVSGISLLYVLVMMLLYRKGERKVQYYAVARQ